MSPLPPRPLPLFGLALLVLPSSACGPAFSDGLTPLGGDDDSTGVADDDSTAASDDDTTAPPSDDDTTAPPSDDDATPPSDDDATAPPTYTCIESFSNDAEICDDQAFTVPAPYRPTVLVCQHTTGGTVFVSPGTGPVMYDGVPRCQGWEEEGLHPWDNIDYLASFECAYDGQTLDVDLSAWSGSVMYAGVHDDPSGGGHATSACIATWDEGSGDDDTPPGDDDVGDYVCVESVRNGSEICDDQSFWVTAPEVPMAVICVAATGGIGYVSTNTGPEQEDGVARCQGWESNGMNAWDYLEYVDQVECTYDGQILEVDLSPWEGGALWVGSHDHPSGGGHMNEVCIAEWHE